MNSPAPLFNSAIFNNSAFVFSNYLTQTQADDLYISSILLPSSYGTAYAGKIMITDSSNSIQTINQIGFTSMNYNGTVITSTGTEINYLSGITPGTISASKAVIVDANRDITNFRNISLSGTLIASNDISSPIINSNQYLLSGSSILTSALTSITTGTASASKALVLDSSRNIVGINSISTTDLNISGTLALASLTSIINSQIIDTNNASISYPLTIQHLLSSGSPVDNAMEVGLKFEMPNSINVATPYGAISAEVQQHASGLHQGQLNFYTSFAGSLVNAMTLSSLTSPTNNVLVLNGATSLFSAYRLVCDNVLCNSNILISKATLPNLTITSTSSSTLSLCYFNTDNQTWELGARGSTASNPNSFYLYNNGYMYTINNAGVTKFFNSSVSTTSTSNAFQIGGGLYVAKAILNNSNYNCNTINSGATSHSNSTQAICLNDHAIYFRSQNGYDTNHGIMYSKNANWNAGNGFGNPSASIDGPVLFGNAGVMIGNLNSASTETVCATFVGTTTNLFNTVNIAQPSINIAKVNINSPTGIGIINDSTHYANIGTDSNGSVILTATSGGSYSQYYFSYQNSIGLANLPPRSRLDFGNTFNNCIITLYQANSSSGTYQIGCNNSAIQYTSNGLNGHQFYYNSTTTPQALGSNVFSIRGNGNCISTLNSIANAGVHSYGYDTTDLSSYSAGAHMHYAGGKASFFGYDYSGGGYKDLSLNNDNLFIKASNGYIGIGTTSPSCPLHVSGTGNQTTAATFGWLSTGGAGTATAFTNRPFSIRCSGGIMCDSGEIDVLSDIRLKSNIQKLDKTLCLSFIKNIDPISFNYTGIKNDKKHYGYSAQELMEYGFETIVGYTNDENPLLSECIIDCVDKSKIKLDKHTRLVVSLLDIIPILHQTIKLQQDTIDKILAKLESDPTPVESDPMDPTPAKLKRVKKVKKPIVYKQ